jgi:hypothetical protein
MNQTVPSPKEHIDNLEWLVSEGEYDNEMHRRFHQTNWYQWTCESVENHTKYFRRTQPRQLQGCNASYAVLIQALVDHTRQAKQKAHETKSKDGPE